MAYRDDYEALLARVAALEEENRRLRAENEQLRRPPGSIACPKCGRVEPSGHYKFCLGCGEQLRPSTPAAPPAGTSCWSCGRSTAASLVSCAFCGASLGRPTAAVGCPKCHHQNPPGLRFCAGCGERTN